MAKGKLVKGTVISSTRCGDFIVLSDEGSQPSVLVEFLKTGYQKTVCRGWAKKGVVSDPTYPTVYGEGYNSLKYGYKKTVDREKTKAYNVWKDLMRRCYCDKYRAKTPSYEDSHVCEEWKDFQEFAHWFYLNYKEGCELDKDILGRGDSEYSPETCAFIPKSLNIFKVGLKGKSVVGVCRNDRTFTAYCNDGSGRTINLGSRPTEEEAADLYKAYKEALAKKLADEYFSKGLIDERVRDALYSFNIN